MRREHRMARLLRAISDKTQRHFGEEVGIDPSLIAAFELGAAVPSQGSLARMAAAVGLTVSSTEEVLRRLDTLRGPRHRRGAGARPLLDRVAEGARAEAEDAYRRLLALRPPDAIPRAADRRRAAEQLERLERFPQEIRLAVVEVAEELRSWALCERACEASLHEASRDVERAVDWARLAQHVAERVQGPEPWRDRLRGFAAAHVANTLRISGDLDAADAALEEAKRLWRAGSDSAGLLDPGRLPELEASLRGDQGRLAVLPHSST